MPIKAPKDFVPGRKLSGLATEATRRDFDAAPTETNAAIAGQVGPLNGLSGAVTLKPGGIIGITADPKTNLITIQAAAFNLNVTDGTTTEANVNNILIVGGAVTSTGPGEATLTITAGSLEVSDGTNDFTNVTKLLFVGAVVSNPATGEAEITISGGGGGFANPMTTPDDIIVGGLAGAAGRLGKGANGQVLTVGLVSGHLEWDTPSGGGGGSLAVTDGTTSVPAVTQIVLTGATVTSGGTGIADVAISGGGGGAYGLAAIPGVEIYWESDKSARHGSTGSVYALTDLSPSQHSINAGGTQPGLIANLQNGLPGLRFGGASYFNTNAIAAGGKEHTFFFFGGGSNLQSLFRLQGSGYIVYPYNPGTPQGIIDNDGGTGGILTGLPLDGTYHYAAWRYKGGGVTNGNQTYKDGVVFAQRDSANVTLSAGMPLTIGCFGGSSEFFVGDVFLMAYWPRALTDAEMTTAFNYIRAKYAVT